MINRLLTLILVFSVIVLPSAMAKEFEILTGEWAPYVSESLPGGGPTGMIITEALNASGDSVKFEYVPWKRTEVLTQSGKALATFPWSTSPEFEATAYISSPLAVQRMVFFYLKSEHPDWDYKGLESLKNLTVGGSTGYTYVKTFADAGIKTSYAPTILNSLQKLLRKRVDVVPESQLVGWKTIKDNLPGDADKIASSQSALFEKPLFMMVSKSHPDGKELIESFEKGFKVIKESGRYKQILEEYNLSE